MKTTHLLALLVLPILGVSCKSDDPYATSSDPYATSYGADTGYNPYGTTPTAPTYPQYEAPPSAAPDPYAYQAPATPEPSYSPPPSYSAPASSSKSHTVVRGDTLYSLSRRYGSSVSAIKSANGLSSDLIVIGQRLSIP